MSSALIINQKEQIKELIDSSESIGIVASENQDIDTVAAALGLYLVLKSNGKNVQVVSKKTPVVEVSNLVGVDKILKNFAGNTKILTISVPYREGEIEKVSYNIEDTRLNVNLFAETSGITFDENDVQYIRKGSQPSTIVTVGVVNEEELLGIVDLKGAKAIHLDKNPLNSLSGDVSIVDPSFSSLSEIVAELVNELNLGYDLDAFQNLLDGITYATRNFTSQAASPYAFEAAGFLLQNGAKRKERPLAQTQDRPFGTTHKQSNWPRSSGVNPNANIKPAASTQSDANKPFDAAQGKPFDSFDRTSPDVAPFDQTQGKRDRQGRPIEEIESVEGAGTGEIPNDWFLPKVFKGTRKGN